MSESQIETEHRLRERICDIQQKRAAERRALKILLEGKIQVSEIPEILKKPLEWSSGLYKRGIR